MSSWDVPQAAETHSWTRPPTSSAGAGKGISEHTPAQPLCVQEAGPPPFCSALVSSQRLLGPLPRDTAAVLAPNFSAVLGWGQAEGPFRDATISSREAGTPNHSSPTPDSSQSLRGVERQQEGAGREGGSSAVKALECNTLRP